MGLLLKIITFIPRMIVKMLLFPFKQLFSCLFSLIIFLIIIVAGLIYLFTKYPNLRIQITL